MIIKLAIQGHPGFPCSIGKLLVCVGEPIYVFPLLNHVRSYLACRPEPIMLA